MQVGIVKDGFEKMRSCINDGYLNFEPGARARVKRAVNVTLKLIAEEAHQSQLKINNHEMAKDLKALVFSDSSVIEDVNFKAFLVALKEFGLNQTHVLIDILFMMLEKDTSIANQEAIVHFVDTFPELKDAVDAQGRGVVSRAICSDMQIGNFDVLINLGFSFTLVNPDTGNSILHDLALRADLSSDAYVQKMLPELLPAFTARVDINLKNAAGNTALHESLLHRNKAFFRGLVPVSDIETEDSNGRRASHLCYLNDNPPGDLYYRILNSKGLLDLSAQDSQGNTPLHYACRYSEVEDIYALGSVAEGSVNVDGQRPFDMLMQNPNLREGDRSFIATEMEGFLQDPETEESIDLSDNRNRAKVLFKLFVLDSEGEAHKGYVDQLFVLAFQNIDTKLFKFLINFIDDYEVLQELFRNIVSKGNSDFLKLYLDSKFYISEFDKGVDSTLQLAVKSGDLETVKICLDQRSSEEDISRAIELACHPDGLSMLVEFVKRGHFSIHYDLQIEGKPVLVYAYENMHWDLIIAMHEIAEKEDITLFYAPIKDQMAFFASDAACNGCFDLLESLANENSQLIDMENVILGKYIMQEAAKQRNWDFVNQFIECSREYEKIEVNGTPLAFALAKENEELKKGEARSLLTFIVCSDPSLLNLFYEGNKLLELVVQNKWWTTLEGVMDLGYNFTSSGLSTQRLFDLIISDPEHQNVWGFCQELISQGAKFDHVRIQGLPLLHYVARHFHSKDVKKLLEAGASVTQRDEFGRTALFYAFETEKFKNAEALVKGEATIYVEEWNFLISQRETLKFLARIGLLKENPNFLKIDPNCSIIAFLSNINLLSHSSAVPIEKSRKELSAACYKMLCHFQTQQVDAVSEIPDTEYYGNPFTELREFFSTFTEVELDGVLGIDEAVVPVATQREAFEHFLKISETSEVITGVIGDDPFTSYRPIHRMLKHLAKALPSLRREEALTYLTQISRIELGYCIDPYQKVSKWIYGMLESSKPEELAVVVDLGDPIVSLRRDLYAKVREWRDMGMREILGETKGVIDTHARNWAYRYFGPEVGQSYDEVDIYLDAHGKSELAIYLNKIESRESILTELRQRFNSYFLGFAFQNIVRFLKRELASQERVGEGMAPKSSVVMDYFYELVNLEKIAGLERVMESSGERFKIQAYLKMRAYIKSLEGIVENHLGNIGRLEFILKYRQEAKVVEEDAEAVYAKKERIALSEQKIDEEMLLLAKFKGELALALEKLEFYYRDNRNLCRSVDYIEETASAKQTGLSEKYLTYSDTDEISISLEGSWEFFQLIMFHERTSL